MASSAEELGGLRDRAMGLPKGENNVSDDQAGGQQHSRQNPSRSSASANGNPTTPPSRPQASDSNLPEAELAAEFDSKNIMTNPDGDNNGPQLDSSAMAAEGNTNAMPVAKPKRKPRPRPRLTAPRKRTAKQQPLKTAADADTSTTTSTSTSTTGPPEAALEAEVDSNNIMTNPDGDCGPQLDSSAMAAEGTTNAMPAAEAKPKPKPRARSTAPRKRPAKQQPGKTSAETTTTSTTTTTAPPEAAAVPATTTDPATDQAEGTTNAMPAAEAKPKPRPRARPTAPRKRPAKQQPDKTAAETNTTSTTSTTTTTTTTTAPPEAAAVPAPATTTDPAAAQATDQAEGTTNATPVTKAKRKPRARPTAPRKRPAKQQPGKTAAETTTTSTTTTTIPPEAAAGPATTNADPDPATDQAAGPAPTPATPKPAAKRRRKQWEWPQATSTPLGKTAAATTLGSPSSLDSSDMEVTPSGRPKRRAAKAAIEYLHHLTSVLNKSNKDFHSKDDDEDEDEDADVDKDKDNDEEKDEDKAQSTKNQRKKKEALGRGRGKKRMAPEPDSDMAEDSDFVPEKDDDEDEDGDEEGDSEYMDDDDDDDKEFSSRAVRKFNCSRKKRQLPTNVCLFPPRENYRLNLIQGTASNGLPNRLMEPVWKTFPVYKEFRNENLLPWVLPEWIPSAKDWQFLTSSEAEPYVPQEKASAAFMLSRERLSQGNNPQGNTPQRLNRFEAMEYHSERWDSTFFVGGPVWAMDWCPLPDGATGLQYAALYCHRGMDERHKRKTLHTGPGLLQLWDMGELSYRTRPSGEPQLSYCLAQDEGCVWELKWCPSGAWELPSTTRKGLLMPRLGLLAAACSSGRVVIYSLPHPKALLAHRRDGDGSQGPVICRVSPVAILSVGSNGLQYKGESGQCFTVDWLPIKPHNLVAAGFYDGTVALWDVSTKSSLLRLRSPSRTATLFPYHTFLAHDDLVRSVCFCRASSDHMTTAGDDRMTKMWDLQKSHTPLVTTKRYLTTESIWPLQWSGTVMSQENAYVTLGHQGLHYVESGFMGLRHLFMLPRKATVWSVSMSEWLNCCVTGDGIGELMMMLVPTLGRNALHLKKTNERRFPVYRGDMVHFGPETEAQSGPEDEGDKGTHGDGDGGGGEGGSAAEERVLPSDPGGSAAEESVLPSDPGGSGAEESVLPSDPAAEPNTYREAVKKYYIHFHDSDMRSFKDAKTRPSIKRMKTTEVKGILAIDRMPLSSLHKVRFNPNLGASTWVLSAGQAGLVRVHCLRTLEASVMEKLQRESSVQFSAMFPAQDGPDAATTVQSSTEGTVLVS